MKTRFKYGLGALAIVIVAIVIFLSRGGGKVTFQSEVVAVKDLQRTVLATGTVTSSVDLGLAFKTSGIVQKVPVKVGQKAKAGAVLAQLDQRDQLASVAQARASVASATASLQKVREGATSEEVQVAQVALDNAKKSLTDTVGQQTVAVKNARIALLSSGLTAKPFPGNYTTTNPAISGKYIGNEQGVITLDVSNSNNGIRFNLSGLAGGGDYIFANVPIAIGTTGLYVQFASGAYQSGDKWSIEIPNTLSANYVTYLNAYNTALETQRSSITSAESAVATAEANLALKKAMARPADLAAAQASLQSAQASLQAALATLENTIIRAPVAGTVTKVDIKVGEQASALTSLISLQDVDNLYVEANVSEANIALVTVGQKVTYTFDALGAGKEFTGQVTGIDPASTVVSGVVNYKVTSSLDGAIAGTTILPGMTANMSVKVAEKLNALAIPQRAIFEKDGKSFVRVVTNKDQGTFEEKEVTTGLEADGGLVEILSGLKVGDEIVTFLDEKK